MNNKDETGGSNELPSALPADADTINALVDGMAALVLCLCKHMPPDVKNEVARDLARLSANATASGQPIVGRLIGDLSRAAAA